MFQISLEMWLLFHINMLLVTFVYLYFFENSFFSLLQFLQYNLLPGC